jgi:hypothetical protein
MISEDLIEVLGIIVDKCFDIGSDIRGNDIP